VELNKVYPLLAICWAACGKDPGYAPLYLLKMMKRFAKIDPVELDKIKAQAIDPVRLKMAWLEMSDDAEAKIKRIATERQDLPIGVAFVNAAGKPGWIGDDPTLRPHAPSVRGCWPEVRSLQP
jgi:hypothetical protein